MKHQLHISVAGRGRDVVLLHGWSMHSGIWHELAEVLSKTYRVHLVDLPGHGQSTFEDGFTVGSVCEQLHEQLSESATWIGWSLGGMIAMQMAGMFPQQVERLILFASNPCFEQRTDWPYGMEACVLDNFARELKQDNRRALQRFNTLQVHGAEYASQTLKLLNSELYRYGPPEPEGLDSGLEILKHTDLRHILRSLQCPLAMIFGQYDALVPVDVIGEIEKIKPDCNCITIAGAGHIPFVSHFAECSELVTSLLAGKIAVQNVGIDQRKGDQCKRRAQ